MAVFYERFFNVAQLTTSWQVSPLSGISWCVPSSFGAKMGSGALVSGGLSMYVYIDEATNDIYTTAIAKKVGYLSSGVLYMFGKGRGMTVLRNGVEIAHPVFQAEWRREAIPYEGGTDVEFTFKMDISVDGDDGGMAVSDIAWVEDGSVFIYEDFSSLPAGQLTEQGLTSASGLVWRGDASSPALIVDDSTRAMFGAKSLHLKCLVVPTHSDLDTPTDNRIATADLGNFSGGTVYIFARNKGNYYPPPTFTDVSIGGEIFYTIKVNKKWHNAYIFQVLGGDNVRLKLEERFQGQQGYVYIGAVLIVGE
jgi:hypothetical protein